MGRVRGETVRPCRMPPSPPIAFLFVVKQKGKGSGCDAHEAEGWGEHEAKEKWRRTFFARPRRFFLVWHPMDECRVGRTMRTVGSTFD